MKTKIGAVAAALLIGTAFLAGPAAPAHAATIASSSANSNTALVASDPAGVVIAQDQSAQLIAEPSAPRAVTVTTEPGAKVTLTAKGTKAKTARATKDGTASFTKLTAGKNYTVTSNGKQTQVTPVVKVGKASDLTVTTTDRIDTVDLTWQHRATKARGGGSVGYTITATPAQAKNNNDDALAPITLKATGTSAKLTGLDPAALYSFSVTPHNALGDGAPSVARMNRSLADITGIPIPTREQERAPIAPVAPEATAPAPQPAQQPVPDPTPKPAPAPQPSIRTIWVCPDGYSEIGGVCTQERAYTYTELTEIAPYTYSQNFHQTGWQDGSFSPAPCTFGTYHANGPQGEGCYVAAGPTGYYTTDKDAPPSGWTDDGSHYTRTVSSKDAPPAGFTDNGTAWVRTADKIAREVTA